MRFKFIIVFTLTIIFGCKKDPQIIPVTNGPTSHQNLMTAKVNGQDWTMLVPQGIEIIRTQQNIQFHGHASVSNSSSIFVNFVLPDTNSPYYLTTAFQGVYIDQGGTIYVGRFGNLNISSIDTASSPIVNGLNKLTATFNFTTFPVNGQTIVVQDGVIDFEKN